jgi:predicted DNA binding CopG/RHH family protein
MMKERNDAYEKEILDALDKGTLKQVPNVEKEMKRYQKFASDFCRKTDRITIRISPEDKESLKARAREEGIPYQTLLSSIIHKYLTGRFVEATR